MCSSFYIIQEGLEGEVDHASLDYASGVEIQNEFGESKKESENHIKIQGEDENIPPPFECVTPFHATVLQNFFFALLDIIFLPLFLLVCVAGEHEIDVEDDSANK